MQARLGNVVVRVPGTGSAGFLAAAADRLNSVTLVVVLALGADRISGGGLP